MKILLLEDDKDLGRLILEGLKSRQADVVWYQSLTQALHDQSQHHFNLAIVDLNLPDGQGFEMLQSLLCPVIIMSALSDPQNRLRGAELGAVDFIPKPFLLQELFIKIDRLLGEQLEQKKVFHQDGVTLDLKRRQIATPQETHLLNKRDFRLLEILIQHAPQVVTRNQIIDYVYGQDQNPSQRTIDNAVVGIRQMLGDDKHEWIRSVRGEGYQWMKKGES